MRVQPYGIGSIIHVMKRGARGLPITRNIVDQYRFARLLYFANEEHRDEYWEKNTINMSLFERPSEWPKRKPLVNILMWVLMPNHFHLLLEEIQIGGMSKFMQQLCGSMSANFNARYKEKGSLFQGAYKGLVVDTDTYLRQLIPYIMVKNVFEIYPGGYEKALSDFDKAWQWGVESYPFSSLPEYAAYRDWPILEKDLINGLFPSVNDLKSYTQDIIENRSEFDAGFSSLIDE